MKKLWFKRKLYGWGWTPASWEGWMVLLIWAVLFTVCVLKSQKHVVLSFVGIWVSVIILLYICYKKGERPCWQWGTRKED
jgi:hypothetical protein